MFRLYQSACTLTSSASSYYLIGLSVSEPTSFISFPVAHYYSSQAEWMWRVTVYVVYAKVCRVEIHTWWLSIDYTQYRVVCDHLPPASMSVYLPTYLPARLSVCLSVCLYVCMHLFIFMFSALDGYPTIRPLYVFVSSKCK